MTNGAHVGGKGGDWSGFLHVRAVAGGHVLLPEAPGTDQSNLLNVKSVLMDCDQRNSHELIISRYQQDPTEPE